MVAEHFAGPESAPTPERLMQLIDLFQGRPVAMLVDLVADRFLSGTPKRISREAPVLILTLDQESTIPGGGANAVANVASLGGSPLPLGVVGDDVSGRELVSIFQDRGVDTRGILTRPGYRTPTKTRVLGGGRHTIKQQIVRYDVEDEWSPTAEDLAELLSPLGSMDDVGAAVMSDYGYGAVRPEMLSALRDALPEGTAILGDSRYRLGEYRGLAGATPNLEEAEKLSGRSLDASSDLASGGRQLLNTMESSFLLVTRGSSGMTLFYGEEGSSQGGAVHLPVHGTDQVADVTGAGDTVIGTFALSLAAGATPLEAACLANYAGGVVVMKMGTATLDPDELRDAVQSDTALLDRLIFETWGSGA